MKEDSSAAGLRSAAFAALMAPMAGLPGLLARQAGGLSWAVPLLALPIALLGQWMLRRLGPEGLGRTARRVWGRGGGPAVALWYLWTLGTAALAMGGCTGRITGTDYGGVNPWLLSLGVTAAAWYLTSHGPAPFFRAARIFRTVFIIVLAVMGVLGVGRVDRAVLRPGPGDGAGLLPGLLPVLGALGMGSLAAFFPREAPRRGEGWQTAAGWCLAASGTCLLVTGLLGPKLTGELPLPFFLALQGSGVPGGLRRMEALGTALWALSDLTLLGTAALAGEEMTGSRWGRWPVLAAGAIGGGLALPAAGGGAYALMWGSVLLGGGAPAALLLTKFFRGRKKGG